MRTLKNSLKKIIIYFSNTLKPIFSCGFIRTNYLCRIEEINLVKNLIIIHCRGIEAPIKLKFEEVINDAALLSNFSSKHASWIGYYYGKYYNTLIDKKSCSNIPFSFSPATPHKTHRITMVTRHGDLVYSDNTTGTVYTMHPIRIMTHKDLIMSFDSTQACYIGFLSGIFQAKIKLHSSAPLAKLELVK